MRGVFVNVGVAGRFNVHDYSAYRTFFCFLRFPKRNYCVHTNLDRFVLKSI